MAVSRLGSGSPRAEKMCLAVINNNTAHSVENAPFSLRSLRSFSCSRFGMVNQWPFGDGGMGGRSLLMMPREITQRPSDNLS